uniref:Uncharacterized protein n=1 Tax=Ceratitis capitata TaxID=7213 RepID=W8BL53_CERCA
MVGTACSAIPMVDAASRFSFIRPHKAYSSCTLVGNWYNERICNKDKTFNPINYKADITERKCLENLSSYRDHYADPKQIKREDAPSFEEQRVRYKRNVHKGKDSSVLIMDSEKYLANYTTLNDIKYRLQPPKDTWNLATKAPTKALPKENLLRSYGNETNFGLRRWLTNIRNQARLYRTDDTTYSDAFRHPERPQRRHVRYCR